MADDLESLHVDKLAERQLSDAEARANAFLEERAAARKAAEPAPMAATEAKPQPVEDRRTLADLISAPSQPSEQDAAQGQSGPGWEQYFEAKRAFEAARPDIEAGRNRAYKTWADAQAQLDQLRPVAPVEKPLWKRIPHHLDPLQAAGGALDAVDNTFHTIRGLSEAGNRFLMDLGVPALTFGGGQPAKLTTDPEALAATQDIGNLVPDIGDPQDGGFARGIGQFATGYMAAGRALSGVQTVKTIADSGRLGSSAVALLKGAIGDFATLDGMMNPVNQLVHKFPSLENPITSFLKSDQDDPEIVNKLRVAMVGAGLGAITDTLFAGLRAVRSGVAVRKAAEQADTLATELITTAETQRTQIAGLLGDPDHIGPIGGFTDEAVDAASDAASAGATNPRMNGGSRVGDVYVNWARIDSTDDVKSVIQELANRHSDSLDEAVRGTQTFEQTAAAARQQDAWQILQDRAQGTPLNAEQTLAVRQLWTASGAKVTELANRVRAGGGVAEQIALKKMIAVHAAIQEQVIGIRTETARALSQWRIPAGESDQFYTGMSGLMSKMDMNDDARSIAKAITDLNALGRADSADAFILGASRLDELRKAGTNASDMIRQLYYFSLLSGPKTHARNFISNVGMMFMAPLDRYFGAKLGQMLGGQNVPDGEAMALAYAQWQGLLDAFRISDLARQTAEANGEEAMSPFMRALTTGQSGTGVGKWETPRVGAFDPSKLGIDPTGNWGKALDVIDTATQSTGRALGASDEIFSTAAYNGQVHALAYRQAARELESGIIEQAGFAARLSELTRNPDMAMKLHAQSFAQWQTFQNAPIDSGFWRGAKTIANAPVVGKLALPFSRTPYNLAIESAQRLPTAFLTHRFWNELRAGGARSDIAMAKFVAGNAALIAFADWAINGYLTGERKAMRTDPTGEKQTKARIGSMPMSVNVPMKDGTTRSFAFRGLEPFSSHMGIAANIVEILDADYFDAEDKEAQDIVVAGTMAVMSQAMSANYMSGLSSLVEMVNNPAMYGESYFERIAGTVVPTGVAQIAQANDPIMREANTYLDSIRARIPGLSDDLPPMVDAWGRDITRASGLGPMYDSLSPIASKRITPEPIDQELVRLEKWVGKPSWTVSFGGVNVNMKLHPREFIDYVKLAGNEMKTTVDGYPLTVRSIGYVSEGGGLKDELNSIVRGSHTFSPTYEQGSDGPDGDKAAFIQAIVSAYRDEAKRHLIEKYPEIQAKVKLRFDETPERVFSRSRRNKFLDGNGG